MLPLTAAVAVGVAVPLSVPAPAIGMVASSQVSATVLLAGAADVSALASSSAQPRETRLARLRAATPAGTTAVSVQREASTLGLTVDDTTPWSLVVHGDPGALDRLAGQPGVGSVLRDGGLAPSPAAAPTPLRGAQLRTAYQAANPKATTSGPKPVVATIQFAGWNPAELAGYASTWKLKAPDAGQFTAVKVGTASTTAMSEPGSTEVALDQESIYDTDPYALQRAYFADASAAGMVAALDRVALDAQTLPGLVALSVSWTWCSAYLPPDQLLAIHDALATVVATGVTVFASSGDDGSYCGLDGSKDVSYPAVDPYVIAVGGTQLVLPTAETGWGVRDSSRVSGWYASGGGTSHFDRPSWQQALSPISREVPDIAADASYDSGFFGWHDSGDGLGADTKQWGGTSLASAVSAAAYADELASRGTLDGGLGDLHTSLYSAPAADFRDVTTGSNGLYSAKAGYDMVTGLGAPLWGRLVNRFLTQPVLSVPATLHSRVIPISVSAPAGQTFLAWRTGYGTPPGSCASAAGAPAQPADVVVPADGTFQVWAQGYVGADHCFTVSSSTVVDTGHPAPPTTVPPTTAPPTSGPTTGPTTVPPTGPTAAPVTSVPATTGNPVAVGPPLAVTADVTPPTVVLTARRTSPAASTISFTWRAADTSGVRSATVTVYRDGKPVSARSVSASGTWNVTGAGGHAYRLGAVAVDSAGNIGGAASGSVRLPYDDRSFSVGKGWSRAVSRTAFGGSYLRSSRPAATATAKVNGTAFSLLTTTGPDEGIVAVWVDGRHVRDVSLYSKAVHREVTIALARFVKAGLHRITLVVKGKRAPQSKGILVDLDGLVAV